MCEINNLYAYLRDQTEASISYLFLLLIEVIDDDTDEKI